MYQNQSTCTLEPVEKALPCNATEDPVQQKKKKKKKEAQLLGSYFFWS